MVEEALKMNYASPRWSGEVCDCSMPMTFDTYSGCSFNCLYCFAYFQKSHSVNGYLNRAVTSVNPEKIRHLFKHSLKGEPEKLNKTDIQFYNYIQNKTVMQWGGLNDPFDENEEKYGITLKLLQIFDEYDYPLSISTKGVFFTRDERYMELIRKHPHNWHFKISIITANEFKSRAIERGCPTVNERIEAIRVLAEAGIHVTLRLRPYIIGVSDDYPELILKAKKAGADSVTTEFFCLEGRANETLKTRYTELSKYVGYNIWDYYKRNSSTQGYYRLNYALKKPIIKRMKQISHALGLRFYVSDAHHKERSDYCCCCGVPPEWTIARGQYAEALQIAKNNEHGVVTWQDFKTECEKILGNVVFYKAAGFNTGSNRVRANRLKQTLAEYLHEIWNTPDNAKSPYKYFEGILYPIAVDKKGDVIYKYRGEE